MNWIPKLTGTLSAISGQMPLLKDEQKELEKLVAEHQGWVTIWLH